jgi:hypothetical protein
MGSIQEIPPQSPRKDKTWIWVIVIAGILCVCLAALAVAIGVYSYLGQTPVLQIPPGIIPPSLVIPTPRQPTLPPVPTSESQPDEIIISPYQPTTHESTPTLTELVFDYRGATQPGMNTWNVTVYQDQPVMIYMGWCSTTQEILDQNFTHLNFAIQADGKPVDVEGLFTLEQQAQGMQCRSKVGIIQAWPAGAHQITETMTVDELINDGMGDYSAGDYADEFLITVMP